MADNTVLPGTGETYAADDVGGVKHQRVKISVGADGAAVDCSQVAGLPIVAGDGLKDSLAHAIKTIDYEHAEVHDGRHFLYKSYRDLTGASTQLDFLVLTPNVSTGRWAHWRMAFQANEAFTIELHEGVNPSVNGTNRVAINSRRDSLNGVDTRLYEAPTLLATGTKIWEARIDAGKSATVAVDTALELILKAEEKYVVRIIKENAGTHWVDFGFWWYEHGPE